MTSAELTLATARKGPGVALTLVPHFTRMGVVTPSLKMATTATTGERKQVGPLPGVLSRASDSTPRACVNNSSREALK